MKKHLLSLAVLFLSIIPVNAQSDAPLIDIQPDTWVATDALGRVTPTAADAPLRTDKDRTVGIFYITWHTQGLHNGRPYRADVSRVLEQDPSAAHDSNSPAWTIGSYHWGEPEYGYFLSRDEYVIRHDMSMLADAGVDVIILDVTNAVCYWDEWEVIFRVMSEMKAEGNAVPRFCFWAFNGNVITVVTQLYEHYYKTPRYQDLWFYWDGRPLLLCNSTPWIDANPQGGQHDVSDYPDEIKQFFTLRNMWWGYYEWAGHRHVGTEDNWSFGLDLGDPKVAALTPEQRTATHNGRLEEYAVTPAQHPISIIGKSWRIDTEEPPLDERDMPKPTYVPFMDKECPNPTAYGIYFQDRWDEAISVDPDFIYLNDWNEWTAGKYANGKDPSGVADLHINFLGRTDNPFYFVDQYNAEFNRTIAPMRGGYTDNYYMQMVENIRRWKGVRPIPVIKGYSNFRLEGSLDDCQSPAVAIHRDTRGDVIHRSHDGYGDNHYIDTLGRNDIITSCAAVSRRQLYFAVETAQPITSPVFSTTNQEPSSADNANWMLLFIDADANASTGWYGYDYAVNLSVLNETTTTLSSYDAASESWTSVAEIPYTLRGGTRLELFIPRKLLHLKGNAFTLDYKWVDNPASLTDPISLSTAGDTAPNRRFNYRLIWQKK